MTSAIQIRPARRFWLLALLLFVCGGVLRAETVETMPAPTGYVNDFAGVIDADSARQMTAICQALDQQAHAQVAIVTIHTLNGDTAADFANRLEERWKVGDKKTDRGVLMLFAIDDHKRWIEIGYGLEGVLNDAKVGDIGRSMVPQLQEGEYGPAILGGLDQIASDIAADAHVTLQVSLAQPVVHRQAARQSSGSIIGHIVFFLVILLIVIGFSRGGRGGGGGLGWFLLGNFLGSAGSRGGWGGGGGSWGGGDSGGGGGFGGFGGGSSGGGGAGGSW